MTTFWLVLVQWLHVLGGIVWFGAAIFMAAVMWPMIFRQPAPQARALFDSLGRQIGGLMGAASQVVLWLGLLRGTWLGPIKSFDALFGTSYGHTFAVAILLTLVLIVYGATSGPRLVTRVFDGDQFRSGAQAYVRRSNAVILVLFAAILLCMVLMRFGL